VDTCCGGTSNPPYYEPQPGNIYYLYGSLALLDSPGEWFQDPSTGTLYLWAPDGANPGTHQVEEAARERVFDDEGQSYLELENLYTFAGGVFFSSGSNCLVSGVNQKYTQHFVEVNGFGGGDPDQNGFYNGSGGTWTNGSIQYAAANGLCVYGTGHTVSNMVISEVDYLGAYYGALHLAGSGNTIVYNTLFDSGRYQIWHDSQQGGLISHNLMYNSGLVSCDVGATYSYEANGSGLVISYNIVHDTWSLSANGSLPPLGMGIYLDQYDTNYVIHHNLVYNCAYSGIHLNQTVNNNQVINNTLVNCGVNWIEINGGATVTQTGTSMINNLGVGTGVFSYSPGPVGPVSLNSGTYLPDSFVPGGYQLAAGSGAIDQGLVVPGITDGYCGSAPDVGAYEYNCSSWSAGATYATPVFPYPLAVTAATATPTPSPTSSPTPTATPTTASTITNTPTSTNPLTATSTPTLPSTPTATPTTTSTLTNTPTSTTTATSTPTPSGITFIPPYPNPVLGPGPLNIPIQAPGNATATWDVFTTAFRKVAWNSQALPANGLLTWDLKDGKGGRVANGLYYIRLNIAAGQTSATKILKVIILQ
jgi:hypothetical protein